MTIGTTQNNSVAMLFEVEEEAAEVFGTYRLVMVHDVLYNSFQRQLRASYQSAVTGAHRWPVGFRPEVLIDATGRML
jgi:hypothetical protein